MAIADHGSTVNVQISDTQQELAGARQARDELKRQSKALIGQVTTLRTAIADLQSQLDQTNQREHEQREVEELQRQLTANTDELSRKNVEQRALEEQVEVKNQHVDALEQRLTELHTRIEHDRLTPDIFHWVGFGIAAIGCGTAIVSSVTVSSARAELNAALQSDDPAITREQAKARADAVDRGRLIHGIGLGLWLVSSTGFAGVHQVRQYQGACSSASTFEPLVDPLGLNMLGVHTWAKTLGEAALAIAPKSASTMESWELVFTGEGPNEPGIAKRRAIGYSKSFLRGVSWVAVPSGELPLVSADERSTSGDFRNPTIAIARTEHAERVIAYTAGGSASQIELGRLKGSGELKLHSRITPESTDGACQALAHPALAAQSDGGFLLYFTCCQSLALDCGGSEGDAIWSTRLNKDLHVDAAENSEPRPVKWDKAVQTLLKAPRYIVSADAVSADSDDGEPLWLLLRSEEEGQSVYLTRYASEEKRFKLHSEQPVLTAARLCGDHQCTLDSVGFTRADSSVIMVAVVSSGVGNQSNSSLYVLSQPLGAQK